MSAATVKLLHAAADVLGSEAALAGRLGIEEWLLRSYLSDSRELPDALLLPVVDVLLADRPSRLQPAELSENIGRGSGATGTAGERA